MRFCLFSILQLLMNRKLHNMKKLVPVKLDRLIHMADFFRYASKNLIDKPVIAMNSDIGKLISFFHVLDGLKKSCCLSLIGTNL